MKRFTTSLLILFLSVSVFTLISHAQRPILSQDEDVSAKKLKDGAKEVVKKLSEQDFEGVRDNFNDNMRENLKAEKIEEVWTEVTRQIGKFRRQEEPRLQRANGHDAVFVRCQFEQGAMRVEVWYDDKGNIGGLWIRPIVE